MEMFAEDAGSMQETDGSVTSPAGWRAATAACGLRDGPGADLALVVSGRDCTAAGLFTRNLVAAAPVEVDRELLQSNADRVRAVVINAGIANACTGEQGLAVARGTQSAAAAELGCQPHQVLVMSTGVIGAQLDLAKVSAGLEAAAASLSATSGAAAAEAIMTTDRRPKQRAVRVGDPAGSYTVGGIAKGAGMIHPDMATMLTLLTTDADVDAPRLQELLAAAVDRSFHRISIDGDTSTNDTVLLLANGASGVRPSTEAGGSFARALDWICGELALEIVRDGEGASRQLELWISGAVSEEEALLAARAIATSPLVKTALAGGDPNWGRVVAAAGRSGAQLDPGRLALWVGSADLAQTQLVEKGAAVAGAEGAAAAAFQSDQLTLRLDLGVGEAETCFWTTDLTHDYVSINAEYHT